MTWEISISAEGWGSIHDNLHNMPREDLEQAIVANRIDERQDRQGMPLSIQGMQFFERSFTKALAGVAQDVLADLCMFYVEKHNSCSNGGWEAYIDKDGYHTVVIGNPHE